MKNKNSELKIRISKLEKEKFLLICKKNKNTYSQVIRQLIKIYNQNNFIQNEVDRKIN